MLSLCVVSITALQGQVAPLPANLTAWLKAEAHSHGVQVGEMARAMLVDAINEAMEAQNVDKPRSKVLHVNGIGA